MKLSIIIVDYKSEKLLKKALESLRLFPSKYKSEIIIIDNNKKNLGYGGGNNQGALQAKGEYLLFMNPDIEVKEGALDCLVDFLENKSGVVAPRLYYPSGATQDSFRRFPSVFDIIIKRIPFLRSFCSARMKRFLMWDIDFSRPSEVDWVVGACFLIPRKIFEEIGGFDKRFFLFFEDTDLCRQIWQKGYKVYFNPLCSAIHNHERLSETSSVLDIFRKKTVRIHIASAFKYFWKWR